MARPKNQTQRRDQLIAAANQVVVERGASAARLTDIAQEAGVTSAAVLYYYPEIDDLLTEVFRQGIEQYCDHREAHIASVATGEGQLLACIQSGIPRSAEQEAATRVLVELAPVVLRDKSVVGQYEAFIARQAALYERVLRNGQADGVFTLALPPEVIARSLVALEDGYVVDVLVGAITADQEEAWIVAFAEAMVGRSLSG